MLDMLAYISSTRALEEEGSRVWCYPWLHSILSQNKNNKFNKQHWEVNLLSLLKALTALMPAWGGQIERCLFCKTLTLAMKVGSLHFGYSDKSILFSEVCVQICTLYSIRPVFVFNWMWDNEWPHGMLPEPAYFSPLYP